MKFLTQTRGGKVAITNWIRRGPTYNLGIAILTSAYELVNLADCKQIGELACAWRIDMAIIGPEAPLAYGLVDQLEKKGIACIGPNQDLAQIETSKIFARTLIQEQNCSPCYRSFQDLAGVDDFLHELDSYVIKPDGLTGGKGVKVSDEHVHSRHEAFNYCRQL